MFGFFFALLPAGRAQNGPTEYQVKAAFVYNFVKFVDWPSSAFTNANSPYVIGVLGDNAIGDNLKQAVVGRKINGRPLEFVTFHSARDALDCQVLFISKSERRHYNEILAILRGKSILTIGESDGFIDAGGIINFVILPDRTVHFQINQPATKEAGLKMSSDLLNLAIPAH